MLTQTPLCFNNRYLVRIYGLIENYISGFSESFTRYYRIPYCSSFYFYLLVLEDQVFYTSLSQGI